MSLCGQHRQPGFPEGGLGRCYGGALRRTLRTRGLEMRDRRSRSCGDRGWQGCSEDKTGCMASDGVHHGTAPGDVTAERAEGFCERSLDEVDARHQPLSLGDPGAAWPVHANGVYLVEVGHRAMAFRQVTDRLEWSDVPVHRIHALEHDQLGAARRCAREQLLEVPNIIVTPDLPGTASGTHAFDHRIVI